ncbi:MAG: sigma-54 interaction domain-containing protein [Azovibrio sp.]
MPGKNQRNDRNRSEILTPDKLRELVTNSLLSSFADMCEGVVIVDAKTQVVWMNDRYPMLLGIKNPEAVIGKPVEAIIPNSLMRQVVESGNPIMLDVMEFGTESFVVTRLPLRDDEETIIGAVGLVLYNDPRHLAPVVSHYQRMRADLACIERKLTEERRTKYSLSSFIGISPRAMEVKNLARRAARTSASVLILGETGTGKELLAHAIHAASPRAKAPFVAVNVAAIPETLLETEFFGVASGAYTGADKRGRDGKFRLADGGTLFLDEIGDMPLALQAKLLRTLQEKEVEPVGSSRLISIDVRVIAATSKNLEQMVADGLFRADLYYRLNVLTLTPPPLRNRMEDLPLLAESLIEQICRQQGIPLRGISESGMARLQHYDWPGNVRELANILERALLISDDDNLDTGELDAVMPAPRISPTTPNLGIAEIVAQTERKVIHAALQTARGNKTLAAKLLGISRAALYEKIASLGVEINAT